MKPQQISARFDRRTNTITLSFDHETFHNIHFTEGFERAFDRLVEVLSEKFDVRVEKKEWVCADDCENCSETGTEYTVGCKGYKKEKDDCLASALTEAKNKINKGDN